MSRENIVRKIAAHVREDRTGTHPADLFAWSPGGKMTVVYLPWSLTVTLYEMRAVLRRVGT